MVHLGDIVAKKFVLLLLVIFSSAILLLAGCEEKEKPSGGSEGGEAQSGGGEGEQEEQEQQSPYSGFMEPSSGQWAEYVFHVAGKTMNQKMECIGEEMVEGKLCLGFETTVDVSGMRSILQMWIDKSSQSSVKYVIKMNNQVYCMDPTSVNQNPPDVETPDAYKPENMNYTIGEYTVPGNGQTIKVAIFHGAGESETWVSSEVPFGLVKIIDKDGNELMHLENFGLTGAKRDISAEERDNCTTLSFPI